MRARDSHWPGCYPFVMALLALGACTTPDKVALKEYAPKSEEAAIEAVSLSASDDDTFDPSRVGTEFPDTTEQVAVWYRWDQADSGKKVGIRWSKDGQVVLEQGDTLVKVSGASAYVLKMAAGSKLPIGDYQVELLEDGVAVTKIPFKVGDAGEAGGENVAAAPQDNAEVAAGTAEPDAPAPSEEVAEDQPETEAPAAEAAAAAIPSATAPAGRAVTVLASQETKWPGVVVELTELVQKGNTLNAKLRFTNNGTKEVRPDFYYRDTYVLDGENKKYEVLKDDKGCLPRLGGERLHLLVGGKHRSRCQPHGVDAFRATTRWGEGGDSPGRHYGPLRGCADTELVDCNSIGVDVAIETKVPLRA